VRFFCLEKAQRHASNTVRPSESIKVETLEKLHIKATGQHPSDRVAVAICIQPEELSDSILATLRSLKSEKFFFFKERTGAKIVVSNCDEIMFEVLESDEQEYFSVSSWKGNETRILEVLKRKFQISSEVENA
jgi:hypothetical protein